MIHFERQQAVTLKQTVLIDPCPFSLHSDSLPFTSFLLCVIA